MVPAKAIKVRFHILYDRGFGLKDRTSLKIERRGTTNKISSLYDAAIK